MASKSPNTATLQDDARPWYDLVKRMGRFVCLESNFVDSINTTDSHWQIAEALQEATCPVRTLEYDDHGKPEFFQEPGSPFPLAWALISNNSLRELIINSKIGDDGLGTLANGIRKNRALQKLRIRCDGIGDKGMIALAQALGINDGMKSLSFQNAGSIGVAGIDALANALRTRKSPLRELGLPEINILPSSCFADFLKETKTLEYLDLKCSFRTPGGLLGLEEAFALNTSLVSLDLAYCSFNLDDHRVMGQILLKNETLRSLIIPNGKHFVVDALLQNTTLRKLEVLFGYVDDDFEEAMAKMLTVNNTLEALCLRNLNNFPFLDGKMLADALRVNSELRSLNLSHYGYQKGVAVHFVRALNTHTKLQSLTLGPGHFDDEAVLALTETLQTRNVALRNLRLSGSIEIGVDALKVLAGALKTDTILELLDLTRISMHETTFIAFSEVIATNRTLRTLALTWKNEPEDIGSRLKRSLEDNRTLVNLGDVSLLDTSSVAQVKLLLLRNVAFQAANAISTLPASRAPLSLASIPLVFEKLLKWRYEEHEVLAGGFLFRVFRNEVYQPTVLWDNLRSHILEKTTRADDCKKRKHGLS